MQLRFIIRHPQREEFRVMGGWTTDPDAAMSFSSEDGALDFIKGRTGTVIQAPAKDEQFASRHSQGALADYDPFGLGRS